MKKKETMTLDFRRRVFHESDSLGAPKYPIRALSPRYSLHCEYLREYSQTFEISLIGLLGGPGETYSRKKPNQKSRVRFPLRLQSQPNYRERNFEFQFQGQSEGQALDITSQIIPPPPSQFILNLKGQAIKIGHFLEASLAERRSNEDTRRGLGK